VNVITYREVTINNIGEIIPIGTVISQKCTDLLYFAAVALKREWKLVNA
jgi:hypothetical protein